MHAPRPSTPSTALRAVRQAGRPESPVGTCSDIGQPDSPQCRSAGALAGTRTVEFHSRSCWLRVPSQCDGTRWEREGMASRGESGCWRGAVQYSGTDRNGERREEEGDNRRIKGRWLDYRGGEKKSQRRETQRRSTEQTPCVRWSVVGTVPHLIRDLLSAVLRDSHRRS